MSHLTERAADLIGQAAWSCLIDQAGLTPAGIHHEIKALCPPAMKYMYTRELACFIDVETNKSHTITRKQLWDQANEEILR